MTPDKQIKRNSYCVHIRLGICDLINLGKKKIKSIDTTRDKR